MKAQRSTVWLAILAGALIASADSSLAQQKTVKECDAEWQANKAAIQASGKTKKDYVAACRQGTGHATAQPSGRAAASADGTKSQPASKASPRDTRTATQSPTRPQAGPAPEAKSPSAKASPRATGNAAAAQYSTMLGAKAHCPTDTVVWVNTDSKVYHYSDSARYGKTKAGAYMCEKDTVSAGFRTAGEATKQAPMARAQPDSAAETRTQPSAKSSPRPTGNAAAAQFSTVLAAKAHCPTDTVVWANTDSKIYHYSDSARYGKTKDGAYMCEKDTASAGFRAAKNEKRP